MPEVTDVLKNPKGMAAAGAAIDAIAAAWRAIFLLLAAEGIAKLAGGSASEKASDLGKEAKGKAEKSAKKVVGEVADEKLSSKLPSGLGGLLKGKNGSQAGDEAQEAHGSGRRMPIQQSVDVAAPIKETYDQWTRFEDWPKFMHRVESAQQVDDSTVQIHTKVWGVNKEFEAEIVEQRPDERIEWHSESGLAHSGVVSFHKLAPRLTRIEVSLDVKPNAAGESGPGDAFHQARRARRPAPLQGFRRDGRENRERLARDDQRRRGEAADLTQLAGTGTWLV